MKVLLISDAHSNHEALEAVLNQVSYDEVLFMGDVVDYGPNPKEVLDLLHYVKARMVLGNHDVAAARKVDCRSSPKMHEASIVTRKLITWNLLSRKSLDLLGKSDKKLNVVYDGLRIRMLHGAPGDELYHYMSIEEAKQLDIGDADLLLVGHTHIAYEVKQGHLWVVNPGSVGMPKDGDSRASYAILDTANKTVTFGRAKYNVELMLSKLGTILKEERSIFELLAKTFKTGE